ncbi:hypothetical protein [Agrobacterium tumefaciens]|uniref:hypothetical protein n=2 Tax=Agrobacterium tumefaciens TaxID=358 RepID=UPI003B9E3805
MSDQSKNSDGIHENHYCEHPGCKKWGGFGYSRSKAEKSTWHCWAHYPHKEMKNPPTSRQAGQIG